MNFVIIRVTLQHKFDFTVWCIPCYEMICVTLSDNGQLYYFLSMVIIYSDNLQLKCGIVNFHKALHCILFATDTAADLKH